MRQCTLCGEEKPLTEFYPSGIKGKGYWQRKCKVCHLAVNRSRPIDPAETRRRRLKWRYGLTLDDIARITEEQGGGCAICGKSGRLVVDHDHACCRPPSGGKTCGACVRGLLCGRCNTLLGYHESASWRARFDSYLSRPQY